MAFCVYCGQEIIKGANFCANCGKAVTSNKSTNQRKTIYDGELHKCPSCGEQLGSFVTTCSSCGYEIRGTRATNCVDEFAKKLEKAETIEKKLELIRNFYIPNTKEDIYEFFILATSNINAGSYDVEAWYAKLDQAYQKAKFSFGNTSEFQHLNQLYMNVKKNEKSKVFVESVKASKKKQCLLLGGIGVLMMLIGMPLGELSGNGDSVFYWIALIGFGLIVLAIMYARRSNPKN